MTLLRELIDIPETVQSGDFVMSLSSGIDNTTATLGDYVVTEQLVRAFDDALSFIASALREGKSKAAYLDGSFGSGKSHFMAVLHLILQGNPDARAIPDLAATIAQHDAELKARSFGLVPFHMIGAESMEEAILGGYVKYLQKVDPDVAPPAVYRDAPIFEQAEASRAQLGDDAFFARLNEGKQGGGWGDLGAAWNSDTYFAARNDQVGSGRRNDLVGDIVARFLPGYRDALQGGSAYVDLDAGLAALAHHAKGRGQDALILFLDELVLWLGTRIADPVFVAREGQKLVKLVEYSTHRPIPLISFVARQRDLRDFIGEHSAGNEMAALSEALKHWNDRFHRVELTDRDLPLIAQKRLLSPTDDGARLLIDGAFREVERARPEVLDILTTSTGDRDAFRATYPFSPAFMQALVVASSALQRERTGLRVMLQLLVRQRDELELGDLVSVGELFDVLSSRYDPFTSELRRSFEQALILYRDGFLPMLLAEHGLSLEEADGVGRAHPFRADDRLVKTLLLAALLPSIEVLRDLDVARLTALNHGSIKSPIPGAEKQTVLGKLRRWAAAVGALKLGDDPQNPTVSVRLTGVDIATIVDRAAHVDNAGERRRLVQMLVLGELGVDVDGRLFSEHSLEWRGTPRTFDLVLENIRDTQVLPDDALRARDDRWKVVIDYPFDPGHAPGEDIERLERWRSTHGATRTVGWIPAFFSQALQGNLKDLVIITHVLSGERLNQFADHLSPEDRQQARGLLADRKSSLEQRVRTAIRQAYGVERAAPETIDTSHELRDRIVSLHPDFSAQIPVGSTLRDAFANLAGQMLESQFPAHPHFEGRVQLRDLKVVLDECLRAVDAPGGRIEVPSDRRGPMRRIATPLGLGVQHDVPFLLADTWRDHLARVIATAAKEGREAVTVGDLRGALDATDRGPMGVTAEVSALVVIVVAAQTGRAFQRHGGSVEAALDRLDDDLVLVSVDLPADDEWRTAVARAASVFGIGDANPARNPTSVDRLAARVREAAAAHRQGADDLVPALDRRLDQLGVDRADSARLASAYTAREVAQLSMGADQPLAVVRSFAALQIAGSPEHVGTSLATAAKVTAALGGDRWDVLDRVIERAATGDPGSTQIAAALSDALTRDEFAVSLAQVVDRAYRDAVSLLAKGSSPLPPPPPPPPDPPGVSVVRDARRGLSVDEARAELAQLEQLDGDVEVAIEWTITTTSATRPA